MLAVEQENVLLVAVQLSNFKVLIQSPHRVSAICDVCVFCPWPPPRVGRPRSALLVREDAPQVERGAVLHRGALGTHNQGYQKP